MSRSREERKPLIVKLARRQHNTCYLCGCSMTFKLGRPNTATIEHVIPRSRSRELGLGMADDNKKAACYDCNQKKASQTLREMKGW